MAIEWQARINRPVSVGAAARLTATRLAELLGAEPGRLEVRVVPGEGLDVPHEPVAPALRPSLDYRFEVAALAAGAAVSLSEYERRGDDPETGLFAWVSSSRTHGSHVLCIAAVCAFAELAGSEVVEEQGRIGAGRLLDPREVVQRLRVRGPVADLDEAVRQVLRGTSFRDEL